MIALYRLAALTGTLFFFFKIIKCVPWTAMYYKHLLSFFSLSFSFFGGKVDKQACSEATQNF